MKGNIYFVADNYRYGFINGEDGEVYHFAKAELLNCKIDDLEEGDLVEFNYTISNNKHNSAVGVKKLSTVNHDKEVNTCPGINPRATFDHFSKEEYAIINKFSRVFYITNSGSDITIGESQYKYFIIKPTNKFSEQFNLKRELAVVFSDYYYFEPRTLDAASYAINCKQRSNLRLEKICSVLVSRDPQIETKIRDLLKNDLDMQAIIPFSYEEFSKSEMTEDTMINRFRNSFFDRDLFAFSAPIQKDLYFFGRRDYVQSIVNRAMTGEHSGVFGLRRSGKTSVLFAIQRALDRNEVKSIFFDCEELHGYRWNEVLYEIVARISSVYQQGFTRCRKEYSEKRAAGLFREDLLKILPKNKLLVLLFDEIERLTFEIAMTEHWKIGNDFVLFWQVIRSFYQTYPNRIAIIIAGTNPKINETPLISGYDNPMFEQLSNDTFLPAFDLMHTKEMVDKLGGYMGLHFDEQVISLLNIDFGGHPFLIRKLCSSINTYITNEKISKPCRIDKAIYNRIKKDFTERQADNYCKLILHVLEQSYNEELLTLKRIALNENHDNLDHNIIAHLIGYNIISATNGLYDFKIDIVKSYIQRHFEFEKTNLTFEEKRTEISKRRNRCEVALRTLIKTQLLAGYGKSKAHEKVINALEPKYRNFAQNLCYDDLLDPNKNVIYFKDLAKIVESDWQKFSNIFGCRKNYAKSHLEIINSLRGDCHAKDINDVDFDSFRASISWLESILKDYIRT